MGRAAPLLLALALLLPAGAARAGLFDDEEARRAILDLRNRITTNDDAAKSRHAELAQTNAQLLEQVQQLRRSLLDLNSQLELQRSENAKLRGAQEQLVRDQQTQTQQLKDLAKVNADLSRDFARDIADLQKRLNDTVAGVNDRIRKIEPVTVALDGKEFQVDPEERKSYDSAMAILRTGDFDKAANVLTAFVGRYPVSGYLDSARFWLGNALYGQKNYKDAISTFRAMLGSSPDHSRAAEAMLAVANCQVEMKDVKSARKTLDDLLRIYPKSEAAVAGKERLGTLKG